MNAIQAQPIERKILLGAIAALALQFACGGDGHGQTGRDQDSVTAEDAGRVDAGDASLPCQDADAGAACGADAYCLAGTCTPNLCGDGVRYGEEECDDGNQVTGDACTPSCRIIPTGCGNAKREPPEECDDGNWFDLDDCSEVCTVNECGNAREDGREECDDGNATDHDACSNLCTENRCRNGRLDPGEECDDGNRIQDDGCTNACVVTRCGNLRVEDQTRGGREECDDGNQVNDDTCSNACTSNLCGNRRVDPGEICDGDTASEDCSDDCQQITSNDRCAECRETHCSNYMDALDLVEGCVESPDHAFREECTAVVNCAHTHGCGFSEAGAITCFCGSVDVGACQDPGAANGACQDEFYAAAHTDSLAALTGTFSDVSLPLGMAFFLLQCEYESCLAECGP
jgi:cysteine-rich repeat protein